MFHALIRALALALAFAVVLAAQLFHMTLLAGGLLAVLLLVLLLQVLKAPARRRFLKFATFGLLGAGAVALSGCAGFAANTNQADLLKQLDTNFAKCDRHITFQAGLGVVTPGAQISGSVDCKGAAGVSAAAPAVSASAPTAVAAPAS